MIYRANKKVWITTELFSEWLRSLDLEMKRRNRKILMFVDNCSAHRRCYEKISYVSNYAFFTLLHKWVDRGQMYRFEELQ